VSFALTPISFRAVTSRAFGNGFRAAPQRPAAGVAAIREREGARRRAAAGFVVGRASLYRAR
jgi:hypothetical protein